MNNSEVVEKIINDFLQECTVIDTEATAPHPDEAEVCEVGATTLVKCNDGFRAWNTDSFLFGTRNPMPFGATKVTGITRSMLKGLPLIDECGDTINSVFKFGEKKYAVAHNVKYDQTLLENEMKRHDGLAEELNYNDTKWVCTYRLARHLLTDDIDGQPLEYALGYLIYALDLDLLENTSHRAGDDALACDKLLEYICYFAIDLLGMSDEELAKFDLGSFLHDLSASPFRIDKFPFGKHKGKVLSEIPLNYYTWCLNNLDSLNEGTFEFDPDLASAITEEMNKRLEAA